MPVFPFNPDLSSGQARLRAPQTSQEDASLEGGGVKPIVHATSKATDVGLFEVFLRIQNHLLHGFFSEFHGSPSVVSIFGRARCRVENSQITPQSQKKKAKADQELTEEPTGPDSVSMKSFDHRCFFSIP